MCLSLLKSYFRIHAKTASSVNHGHGQGISLYFEVPFRNLQMCDLEYNGENNYKMIVPFDSTSTYSFLRHYHITVFIILKKFF